MKKITVDELLKKVDTKYGLINLVSKRAQEMLVVSEKNVKASEVINKIFEEIVENKIALKKDEVDGNKQQESKGSE